VLKRFLTRAQNQRFLGFAFAVFAVAAAASALVVVSGLKRLDLVGVLKARE